MKIRELIELQRREHGPARLRGNVGDGYLFANNPFFRRIRVGALARGFRYSLADPGAYFGFPLTALDTVLEKRTVPYRDNLGGLVHLESSRPGFFELGDLVANRPTPNYVLHESAHAIAFAELFGRPKSVQQALRAEGSLLGIELGEAFAMTAEYFAACAVSSSLHRWLFSLNSYRRRVPGRRAIGELVMEIGLESVIWAVLLAFLSNLFFVERLSPGRLERILTLGEALSSGRAARLPRPAARRRLQRALGTLMLMSPAFRRDTTRLFLTMFGRSRRIGAVLAADPLDLLERDQSAREAAGRLAGVLAQDVGV